MFQDRAMAPEIIEELYTEESILEEQFVERTPCTGSVQCAPDISERQVPSLHQFVGAVVRETHPVCALSYAHPPRENNHA